MANISNLDYEPFIEEWHDGQPISDPGAALDAPDRRDGRVYVLDELVKLAVQVALATGRPLLLRGDPGCGKSSLAAYIARNLGWRYYEHVVTSSTQAQDLLWSFDTVRKLADAQCAALRAEAGLFELYDYDYVEPGVIWWAFDRDSATRRGAPEDKRAPHIPAQEPEVDVNGQRSPVHAVVLIDEIDKADPDVPNGLLVPLGSTRFRVRETGTAISPPHVDPHEPEREKRSRFLVVLTTNEERELPQAFLRRCIVYRLEFPQPEELVEIARRHLQSYGVRFAEVDRQLCEAIATRMKQVRTEARENGQRPPGTAEYLDAVRACRNLKIEVGSAIWSQLEHLALIKVRAPQERGA